MGSGELTMSGPVIAAATSAAIGSLVPDIDHPNAWISNRIPGTLAGFGLLFLAWFGFGNWYVSTVGAASIGASLWIPLISGSRSLISWAVLASAIGIVLFVAAHIVAKVTEHRGQTHSLSVGAVLTLVACVGFAVAGQSWALGMWFGWGYLTHLLADLITPMGCPALLWPLGAGDLSAVMAAGVSRTAQLASRRTGAPTQDTTPSPQVAPAQSATLPYIDHKPEPAHSDYPPMGPPESTDSRVCPKCGGALVLREARRGAQVGNKFYGCSNYPKCRHIANAVS